MSKNEEPIYIGRTLPEMVISSDKNTGLIRLNNVPHIAVKKSKLRKNAGEQYFHKGMKRFWEESPVSAPTLILGLATLPFGASILNAGKTFVTDVATMGKPFYRKLAGDILAGTATGTAIKEGYKATTGKNWSTALRESLPEGPKWIPDEFKEFAADATIPGWYVGANSLTKLLTPVFNQALKLTSTLITKPTKKLIRRTTKYVTADKRLKNLHNKLQEKNDNIQLLQEVEQRLLKLSEPYEIDYNSVNDILDETSRKLKRLIRHRVISNYEPSKIDFDKYLSIKYNPNAPTIDGIVELNGKFYIKAANYPYELKSGEVQIPKFGTNETYSFKIPFVGDEKLIPVSNYNHRNITNLPDIPLENNLIEVPKEYIETLKHNINYILSKFPGSKAFGSSMGVTEAGLPHATGDVDIYVLDKILEAYEKQNGVLPWRIEGLTKTIELDGGKYGDLGKVDLNIIKTKPDGTLDFTSDRSFNIFRQLFPDEYQKAVLTSGANRTKMYSPIQALDVLDKLTVRNTIMDAFESSKPNHKSRALWYLNRGNPDLVYESLLKHGESLTGTTMKHAPVTESNFLNPQYNLELLELLNLSGLENLELIANDPKRMKLIFEYWWQNNTIVGRGTSIENMPLRFANELKVPHIRDFHKYGKRNATEWSGGVGSNYSGTGLNTVAFGDSNGGVMGNDIYVYMQPTLNGLKEGMSPKELVSVVRRNYPHLTDPLTDPIEYNGKILHHYNDILNLDNNISPLDLDKIGIQLGIRGIMGRNYIGNTPYVGITSPVNRTQDVVFYHPALGRYEGYPHATYLGERLLNSFNRGLPKELNDKLYRDSKYIEYNRPILLDKVNLLRNKIRYDQDPIIKEIQDRGALEYSKYSNWSDKYRQLDNELFINKQRHYRNFFTSIPFVAGAGLLVHDLLRGKEWDKYFSQFDLTGEQLELLSKSRDKVRLLKTWEKRGLLKVKNLNNEK